MERSSEKLTDHHILFYAKEWNLRPEGAYLREDGGLHAYITRPEHDEMHRRVALVPMLSVHALQRVAGDYRPSQSLYTNIDNFVRLTEKALKNPKAHELERKLGALTIESVIMQRDFLREIQKRKNVLNIV